MDDAIHFSILPKIPIKKKGRHFKRPKFSWGGWLWEPQKLQGSQKSIENTAFCPSTSAGICYNISVENTFEEPLSFVMG